VERIPADLDRDALPRYVVVEGAIGVGKTTLVGKLSERLDARTVYEVFEENPFLADFYRDPDRYAFQTEMFFLLSRYRQQEQFAQEDLFNRFSVSDYLFVKCRLFGGMTLREHEFSLFDRVYSILGQSVPKPDLVVYLHAPLDVLLERIARRGRSYEQDMDPAYLSKLLALYTDYFAGYNETPLLTVDTTHVDFTCNDAALDALMREMALTKSGRREFGVPSQR
jgi:deoxyguanosine kinase